MDDDGYGDGDGNAELDPEGFEGCGAKGGGGYFSWVLLLLLLRGGWLGSSYDDMELCQGSCLD